MHKSSFLTFQAVEFFSEEFYLPFKVNQEQILAWLHGK